MAENHIPAWAKIIIDVHKSVAGKAVSHAGRLQSDRYFVWQEDWLDADAVADDTHDAEAITGTTDLFTKMEFDPWTKEIEKAFTNCSHITWQKSGLDYEPDTGFWHYSWDWSVI